MADLTGVVFLLLAVKAIYCADYMVALAPTYTPFYISATTGREEGWVQYKLPNANDPVKLQVIPYSRRVISLDHNVLAGIGVENKSFVIQATDEVSVSGAYRYAAFSPLPVSVLGKKYILPFCGDARKDSVLVIAAYNQATEVSVRLRLDSTLVYNGREYRDGETITRHLDPYQTFFFTFKNNVSGTVIEATSVVAVFLGSIYSRQIDTYDQLLPVTAYGHDYVIALEDDREDHELQITSEYNDTEISFSDGSFLKSPRLSRSFKRNETLYFRSSRPVMATLCRRARMVYYSVFVVVPPVKAYRMKKIALYIPYSKVVTRAKVTTIKVMTKTSSDVKIERYTEEQSPVEWSFIPGSQYKVGTCKISSKYSTSFGSNESFSLLAFSDYFVQNGGYGFFDEKILPTQKVTSTVNTTHTTTTPFITVHALKQESGSLSSSRNNVSDVVSRPVLVVAVVGGLVIIALVVVIATVAIRI